MEVIFDNIWVYREDPSCLTFTYDSGSDFVEPISAHRRGDPPWAANISIANYIGNKAKWNAACRKRIEGLQPELGAVSDEDELDESSGDEMHADEENGGAE